MAGTPQHKLEAMRHRFIEQLPQRWAPIEASWTKIVGGSSDNTAIQNLHKGLHTLIGSSGTLGLTAFSRALRRTEKKLTPYLNEDQLPDAVIAELQVDIEQLTQGIDALYARIDQPTDQVGKAAQTEAATRTETSRQPGAGDDPLIYWFDPDQSVTQPLISGLGGYGYRVERFHDWKTYQSSVSKQRPNLAVFELLNPDPGETTLLEHVQALIKDDLPVLVVSTDASFERRLAVARTGADYFLTKPLSLTRLVARIDALTHSPTRRASRVLFVDDQLSVGEYYKALLESIGVRAELQTDPSKVLEHIEQLNPDLVILDIQMPEISGTELARIIRQDENHQLTPLLFLSAEAGITQSSELLALGAYDLLQKGLDDRVFIKQVKARLRRSRLVGDIATNAGLTGLMDHGEAQKQLSEAQPGSAEQSRKDHE